MTQRKFESDRRGFPLSSVIIVTTAVACALACIDLEALRSAYSNDGRRPTGPPDLETTLIGLGLTAIAGIVIGGFIGWRRRNGRVRGLFLGMFGGFIAGILLGLIVAAPGNPVRVVGAGGVLIGTSAVLRWNTP